MEYWMGSACGIYGGEEKCVQGFGKEACMQEIVSQTWALGMDNTKIDLKEIWWECVHGINLAQNREEWWAVVNTVMASLAFIKCSMFID
jgi:hypothetical protein